MIDERGPTSLHVVRTRVTRCAGLRDATVNVSPARILIYRAAFRACFEDTLRCAAEFCPIADYAISGRPLPRLGVPARPLHCPRGLSHSFAW